MKRTRVNKQYTPEQTAILDALGSRRLGERLAVDAQLRQMGPAGAEMLLGFLIDEAALAKQRRTAFYWIFGGGIAPASILGAFAILTHHTGALPALTGFTGLVGFAGLLFPSQRYTQIINALSQTDDVRAVGALAEALSLQDMSSRTAAARALMRLLPRLGADQGELLNSPQRAALHKILNTGAPERESEMMLILIDALARIEDVGALPTMEALARRTPQTGPEARVVRAASQSIEALLEARKRLDTPRVLLRASEQNTSQDQLLRAAAGGSEAHEESLLRASNQ